MRASVDENLCMATGQCELACPEVFHVELVSRVLVAQPPVELHEAVREAAELCPTEAIFVEE